MKKGFTLVELSIVLVIIGLLISGLLVGQSMIKAAKVQSFTREINQYLIAINNFKTKYNQLPGDSTYFSNPGDNDGKIEYGAGGGAAGEWTRIWQHLSESEDLQETYTGGLTSAAGSVPESAVYDDLLYTLYWFTTGSGFNAAGQIMVMGKHTASTHNATGAIPVSSSLAIDVKIDDGVAETGKIRPFSADTPWQPGCLTGTAGPNPGYTTGSYNITNSDALCALYYEVGDELH